jgi:hypothetical protein
MLVGCTIKSSASAERVVTTLELVVACQHRSTCAGGFAQFTALFSLVRGEVTWTSAREATTDQLQLKLNVT